MKNVITELRQLIAENRAAFSQLPEDVISRRPAPGKWSPKEIIGHLVDSAHNNYRRFIVGQYEPVPPHIWYDQDFWVEQNEYQQMQTSDLIQLWVLMNERIYAILTTMKPGADQKKINTGRQEERLYTLRFIAEDYVAHLKHHLSQVFQQVNAVL